MTLDKLIFHFVFHLPYMQNERNNYYHLLNSKYVHVLHNFFCSHNTYMRQLSVLLVFSHIEKAIINIPIFNIP